MISRGRRIAVGALLTAATLLSVCAILGVWAKRQALETDNWVETSGELLESEPIRTAVGLYLVDQLYQTDAVANRLREILPPRLDQFADPAATALREAAERNAPRLLAKDAAQTAWRDANRTAHETLLNLVEGDTEVQEVAIDLRGLLEQVAAENGLPPAVVDRLPPDVASLTLIEDDQLEGLRSALDLFKTIAELLVVLALLLFAAAVWVSRDRRRTLVSVGGCLMLAGLLLLVVRRIAGKQLVDALTDAPNGEAAVEDVWEIATSLLVDAAWGAIAFGLILAAGAWLSGPGRRASALRRLSAPILREQPAVARVTLGLLLLLLLLWGPVPWTQRIVPMLLLAVASFAWLEWLRRQALEEPPPSGAAPAR